MKLLRNLLITFCLLAMQTTWSITLQTAARNGFIDKIQELLDHGADINAKDDYGFTALTKAAWHGYTEVVKLLLEKGADINAKDTALIKAVPSWHKEIVKILMPYTK